MQAGSLWKTCQLHLYQKEPMMRDKVSVGFIRVARSVIHQHDVLDILKGHVYMSVALESPTADKRMLEENHAAPC